VWCKLSDVSEMDAASIITIPLKAWMLVLVYSSSSFTCHPIIDASLYSLVTEKTQNKLQKCRSMSKLRAENCDIFTLTLKTLVCSTCTLMVKLITLDLSRYVFLITYLTYTFSSGVTRNERARVKSSVMMYIFLKGNFSAASLKCLLFPLFTAAYITLQSILYICLITVDI
jgi:hypothetical protein